MQYDNRAVLPSLLLAFILFRSGSYILILYPFFVSAESVLDLDQEDLDEAVAPVPMDLDPDVLEILGDDVAPTRAMGPALQKDITKCWNSLLQTGLSSATCTSLLAQYPAPENCQLLEAPKLNMEVSAAIPEAVRKRDQRMAHIQTQLGASLSALGRTLSLLLAEEGGGNREYIKLLSDAGRLLTDLHHSHSSARREMVAFSLNKDLKDTLNTAVVDGWLFGDQLGERVKAAKSVERSGQDLKPQKAKTTPKAIRKPARNLNYRRPLRSAQGVRLSGRQQQQLRTPAYRYQPRPYEQRPRLPERRAPSKGSRPSAPAPQHN